MNKAEPDEKTCPECGQVFLVGGRGRPKRHTTYCGYGCSTAAGGRAKRVKPSSRECVACGSRFLVGGADNRSASARLCSVSCRNRSKYNTRGVRCRELSAAAAAYIAAMIDGEGHVGLYRRAPGGTYRVALGVTNTHREMLAWIQGSTGVGHIKTQTRVPGSKQTYVWEVCAEAAYSVLEQTWPYMIVKPDRARLAMDFQERLRVPAYKSERSWQDEFKERITKMNQRGDPRA